MTEGSRAPNVHDVRARCEPSVQMSPPRTIRALALATLGLGGGFLLSLGLYTADLATSPQLPVLEELQTRQAVVLPVVGEVAGQEQEREEQLRKLLEDSSEIELQPPVFLQQVYTVQVTLTVRVLGTWHLALGRELAEVAHNRHNKFGGHVSLGWTSLERRKLYT